MIFLMQENFKIDYSIVKSCKRYPCIFVENLPEIKTISGLSVLSCISLMICKNRRMFFHVFIYGFREISFKFAKNQRSYDGPTLSGRQGASDRCFGSNRSEGLGGPFPFDKEGQLLAGEGPQMVNPAIRFGDLRGSKLRAVGDFRRSWTKKAAAVRTPANSPNLRLRSAHSEKEK